jgi:Phosphotransferase enzyme family
MPGPGEAFLTRVGISKDECIAIAKSLTASEDIFPVYFQGMQSYTMQGGSVVVQFRREPIDLDIHDKAMAIHGAYVPPITCKQTEPFYVYVTPYGGTPCCAKEFRFNLDAQKNAIKDVAILLAQSCRHPVKQMGISLDEITQYLKKCLDLPEIQEKVQNLLDNLGSRFQVRADIPDKLTDLPIVLVHGDFATTNILADDDGHVTGIVDWDSSEFLPFGWNLHGVDLFLGELLYTNGEYDFVYYQARPTLETIFWDTFWEKVPPEMKSKREILEDAIKISRGIGLLWRYVGHDSFSYGGSSHKMKLIESLL